MKNPIGYDGLQYYMDGDQTDIVRDDFVSLQESPALFLECPACGSGDIICPTPDYPTFTCDPCGMEFVPDLGILGE